MENLASMNSETKWWEENAEQIRQEGFLHGLPLGIFNEDVLTTSRQLQVLKEQIDKLQSAPEHYEGDKYVEGENPWVCHTEWHTKRLWKEEWGWVVVEKNTVTNKYRKQFCITRPFDSRLLLRINTYLMRNAYTLVEAELKAQARLFEELSEMQKNAYILNGAFVEVGKSGVSYLIRKNRPTLACRLHPDEYGTRFDVLTALCFHPFAFYAGSWAGALPPSDEMLTHVFFIRCDEHLYWRKANQIPADWESSGV